MVWEFGGRGFDSCLSLDKDEGVICAGRTGMWEELVEQCRLYFELELDFERKKEIINGSQDDTEKTCWTDEGGQKQRQKKSGESNRGVTKRFRWREDVQFS